MEIVTKISNNINLYLLKTNNGKFYKQYIDNQAIVIQKKEQSLNIVNEINVGDLILINSYHNKNMSVGKVVERLTNQVGFKMLWLKEVFLEEIHPKIIKFLYSRHTLVNISNLKPYLLRLLYPIYQINQNYHLLIRVNQKNNIKLKSLLGIQQIVYSHLINEEVEVKISIESPGIIEFITDNHDIIIVIFNLIKLLIEFRHKKITNHELYSQYQEYELEHLELELLELNLRNENKKE